MKTVLYFLSWPAALFVILRVHTFANFSHQPEISIAHFWTSFSVFVISFFLPLFFCLTSDEEKMNRWLKLFKAFPFWSIPVIVILPVFIMELAHTYVMWSFAHDAGQAR